MADLEEISRKLDQIIRFFNIDGKNKRPCDIERDIESRVIKLLDRRNRRKENKGI